MKILFYGDSITDCDRDRIDSSSLGSGYVKLIGDYFKNSEVVVLNRGISGNRIRDLKARYNEDCLDLGVDFLTILIGINDIWRKYDSNDEFVLENYINDYKYLIEKAKEKGIKIILMEPFVLPAPPDRHLWREDLDKMIYAVRCLAYEYKLPLVTLDALLLKESIKHGYSALCYDGVHPTDLGHRIIADEWIRVYNEEIK